MNTTNSLTFSKLKILHDDTGGLVKLSTAERIGDNRLFRILNNFSGRFSLTNSKDLIKLINILNEKLNQNVLDEIVVGFVEGSVLLAYELARQRGKKFTCSTGAKIVGYENYLHFSEPHIKNSECILYGLNKGDKITLIEDEISTGDSLIQSIKMLQSSGLQVLQICTIIEVVNFNARQKLKEEFGLELISLIKIELIQ